jgi:uncharacterized membrane protein
MLTYERGHYCHIVGAGGMSFSLCTIHLAAESLFSLLLLLLVVVVVPYLFPQLLEKVKRKIIDLIHAFVFLAISYEVPLKGYLIRIIPFFR